MGRLWNRWKRIAKRIGDFQARLILSVLYFVILGPFALLVRWGADPLSIKRGRQQSWCAKGEVKGSLIDRATRQS